MKNNERVAYGLIITLIIYTAGLLISRKLHLEISFIPNSFVNHSVMLVLSLIAIYGLKQDVNYKIALPKLKNILRPILFGIAATIVVNVLMVLLTKLLGEEIEVHFVFKKMSPLQIFIFVFIYASIAEELLFRGFLLNILSPLKTRKVYIFKKQISLPVIISALLFGLAHLIVITAGVGGMFLLRIVIFSTTLGLIAGYYQEKYDNNLFAIIVHMSGNLLSVISILLMNLNA